MYAKQPWFVNNMKLTLVAVLVSLAVVCHAGPSLPGLLKGKEAGSIWALLVAGSNTWGNYRHQVGTCIYVQRTAI